jgi:hypothetical protein
MNDYFDIGYPKRFGSCHIGLYQPTENRFLLTLCDVQQAQDIALIISGRYPVFLVDLTSAENYSPNLIDNLCCVDWSIPPEQILPTQIQTYSRIIVEAKKLVYCQNQNPELAKEQQYLQMIRHFLKKLDQDIVYHPKNYVDQYGNYPTNITVQYGNYGWAVKNFMSTVFDQQDQSYVDLQNIKKQIFRELFLGRDLDSVKISVGNLITKIENNYDFIL